MKSNISLFLYFIFLIILFNNSYSQVIPTTHPRIFLNESVKTKLATAISENQYYAKRFRDMVDEQLAEGDVYGFKGWYAALLYQLTGNITYGTYAVNFINAYVLSEQALINDGKEADVAFDSYLYVGDIIGDLSLVYDWCYNLLTADQRTMWRAYANQAVWNVWNPDLARWGSKLYPWSGWSINNPMNNYYYSFLEATMLLGLAEYGDDPMGNEWITMFRISKLRNQLIPEFASKLIGGGSREGTGYGISHKRLFGLYCFWQETTGERICDSTLHARQSLMYYLNMVVPTLDWVAPIGDHARESTGFLFDYEREYVEALSYLYRNDPIAGYGKWFLNHCSVPEMEHGFEYVYDFIYDISSVTETPLTELGLMYYAQGIGYIFTRSSWDYDATWINLIAGTYDESHAHHDQGSLMIYKNEWLADDQIRRTHSGIRQEENLHNLVVIENQNGQTAEMQYEHSSKLISLFDRPEYTYIAAEVTPMYAGVSFVSRVERELIFIRPGTVIVFDRADGSPNSKRIWHLNTPIQPVISGDQADIIGSHSKLSVIRVLPQSAVLSVTNWLNVGDEDMLGGYRLNITDNNSSGSSRFLTVLSIDSAVTSVLSNDIGSKRGVNIGLIDGRSVLLHFESDSWGGDLQVLDPNGNIIVDTTLSAGITEIPKLNSKLPYDFDLQQNYPNPFNSSTKITFSISNMMKVDLKIYDNLGREIITLINRILPAGEHTVEWNCNNSAGQRVGCGIYFYQLRTQSGYMETKKMMISK